MNEIINYIKDLRDNWDEKSLEQRDKPSEYIFGLALSFLGICDFFDTDKLSSHQFYMNQGIISFEIETGGHRLVGKFCEYYFEYYQMGKDYDDYKEITSGAHSYPLTHERFKPIFRVLWDWLLEGTYE